MVQAVKDKSVNTADTDMKIVVGNKFNGVIVQVNKQLKPTCTVFLKSVVAPRTTKRTGLDALLNRKQDYKVTNTISIFPKDQNGKIDSKARFELFVHKNQSVAQEMKDGGPFKHDAHFIKLQGTGQNTTVISAERGGFDDKAYVHNGKYYRESLFGTRTLFNESPYSLFYKGSVSGHCIINKQRVTATVVLPK